MRLLNKDVFVVCLSGAITAFCAYLLYLDLNYHQVRDDKSAIASITFRKKIAQRRYSDNSVWEELSDHSPLFNYDSIRTDNDSSAVVTFKDKTEIDIDSNSMIIIVAEGDEVSVNFEGGNISVKKGASAMKVKTDKNSFGLRDGKLTIAKYSDSISADISGGSADIDSVGVLTDANSFVFSDGQAKIDDKKILLKTPVEGEKIITVSDESNVAFKFDGAAAPVIELSKTRNFSKIYKSIPSKGSSSIALSEGTYYWRVADNSDKSEIRRFSVISDSPVKAVYPENNSQVFYRDSDSLCILKWAGAESAVSFEISVSTDPQMKDIVKSVKTFARFASLPVSSEGKYYWNIRADYSGGFIESKVSSFSTVKQEHLQPPVLIAPFDSSQMSLPAVKTGKIRFNWKSSAPKYRIECAKDSLFNDKIFSHEIASNTEVLPLDTALGKYYWRVSSIDPDGTESDFSPIREFNIVDAFDLQLISPRPGYVASRGLLRFRWSDKNIGSLYKIEISKDSNFKNVIYSTTSIEKNTDINITDSGKYFWRVFLLTGDESVSAESKIEDFRIPDELASPVIISPSDGVVFDSASDKPITINWKKVAGANFYNVTLKHIVGGEEYVILTEKTNKNSLIIRNLSKLKPGKIKTEVKSVNMIKGEVIAESKPDIVIFELKLSELLSAPEIRTQGLIYVK